jgi:hypothetical protein
MGYHGAVFFCGQAISPVMKFRQPETGVPPDATDPRPPPPMQQGDTDVDATTIKNARCGEAKPKIFAERQCQSRYTQRQWKEFDSAID